MSDRVEEIRTRLAAATPGPWDVLGGQFIVAGEGPVRRDVGTAHAKNDAHFIAHAPADLAFLLAEVARLRARYETPGVRCNSGHENFLPVSLWVCPECAESRRADAERYRFLRDNPLGLRAVDGNADLPPHPDAFDRRTDAAMRAAHTPAGAASCGSCGGSQIIEETDIWFTPCPGCSPDTMPDTPAGAGEGA